MIKRVYLINGGHGNCKRDKGATIGRSSSDLLKQSEELKVAFGASNWRFNDSFGT